MELKVQNINCYTLTLDIKQHVSFVFANLHLATAVVGAQDLLPKLLQLFKVWTLPAPAAPQAG